MSKKGPTAKRKYITITVPQKHKIINRFESGESEIVVMSLYNIWSSAVYDVKKQKHRLWSFKASIESLNGFLKRQALEEPKLAQMTRCCISGLQQCVL